MEPGRLFFDPTCHGGNMLFLGNNDSLFRGSRSVINLEESSKRRPFFSNSDELYDEEYYDEQSSEKKRRLSLEQVHMLEKSFEMDNKLEPERKTQLSKKLGLQPRQVAVWFQNRRARWKTKTLEKDYDQLKSSYKSILSSYDSLQKENEKLKIEFLSLTEKLQVKQAKGSGLTSGDTLDAPFLFVDIKVEDRLSTGGGRSGVLDEEGPQQLVDCGDSYFTSHECIAAPIVNSEEDDGSDDGQNYFSNVFVEDEVEPLGWWDWS